MRFRHAALLVTVLLFGCSVKQHVKGHYYLTSKNYKSGIISFKEELRKAPDESSTNYYLGRFYLAEGQSKKGLRYLKRAVRLNPGNADYHFWTGVAYASNRRPDLERKSYGQALSLNERHHQALTYLGHNQLEKGELKAALKSYTGALAIQPDIGQALFNRALILKRLGRTPEEKSAWKEYLYYYPSGSWARKAVKYLNESGDFEYRNHRIGHRVITLESIRFEPFTAGIRKGSKPSLDHLGAVINKSPKFVLHIVAYQKKNPDLAQARAKAIKTYLLNKYPGIASNRLKVSWFQVPEMVRIGTIKHRLNQSIDFFTTEKKS